ncbi:MAG: hypothetical protein Q9183_002132 [Haloplaca sp. 2 TL-2023]
MAPSQLPNEIILHGNMTLPQFPNEIIVRICQCLPLSDQLNFILTSRHMYSHCDQLRLKHQRLFRQYRKVGLATGSALQEFFLFLRNPELREYPRYIDLGQYTFVEESNSNLPVHKPLDDELEEVKTWMRDPQSRVNQEALDQWNDALEAGREAPIVALILPLLPNLRTIRTGRSYDVSDYLEQVLGLWQIELSVEGGTRRPENLIEAATAVLEGPLKAPTALTKTGPGHNNAAILGKLTDIVIAPSSSHHRANEMEMLMLALFLAIPSLRNIHAENVVEYGRQLRIRVGRASIERGSLLKSLSLENSMIFTDDLLAFLTPVKALESFSYSINAAVDSRDERWYHLVGVLLETAGHSLKDMRLALPYTAKSLISSLLPGRIARHVRGRQYTDGSISVQAFPNRRLIPSPFELPYLRCFRQLRVVRIRTDTLPDEIDDRLIMEFHGIAEYGIPLLFGHFLPPTIETFEFSGEHIEDRHIERMLESTLTTSSRPDPLPPVKRVSISGKNTQRPFLWEGHGWASFLQGVRRYLLSPRPGMVVDPDVYHPDEGPDWL